MQKHTQGSTEYYTHGETPNLLLVSGMHGDEGESARMFESWVRDHLDLLPPFLYVPFVSPSAMRLGTRTNAQGHDINRQFIDDTTDREVLDFMDIVRGHSFVLGIDLHEDRDRTKSFYLYDTKDMTPAERESYRSALQGAGIPLFTGIDDPDDDTLDCMITDGYFAVDTEDTPLTDGFSNIWLLKHGIVGRKFTLENPLRATAEVKYHMIDTVVPYLIRTYLVL